MEGWVHTRISFMSKSLSNEISAMTMAILWRIAPRKHFHLRSPSQRKIYSKRCPIPKKRKQPQLNRPSPPEFNPELSNIYAALENLEADDEEPKEIPIPKDPNKARPEEEWIVAWETQKEFDPSLHNEDQHIPSSKSLVPSPRKSSVYTNKTWEESGLLALEYHSVVLHLLQLSSQLTKE